MFSLNDMIKRLVPRRLLRAKATYYSLRPLAEGKCNIIGYKGWFNHFGRPPRLDTQSPSCLGLERHRLLSLVMDRGLLPKSIDPDNDKIHHFASEGVFEKLFRQKFRHYQTADLFAKADLKLNLENISLVDNSVDIIVANHVLDHVDDGKVAAELCRILSSGGTLICMVPIVEGWTASYENPDVETEADRWLHFGQYDHVRVYGSDFRKRISKGGFSKRVEYTTEGKDVIDYGLLRGEKYSLL